jgi:hypothetical protein
MDSDGRPTLKLIRAWDGSSGEWRRAGAVSAHRRIGFWPLWGKGRGEGHRGGGGEARSWWWVEDWGPPEVEDAPDRWGPPVGERERGEKRSWVAGDKWAADEGKWVGRSCWPTSI